MTDLDFFKSIPDFSDMGTDEIGVLAEYFDIQAYDDGHVFIREGQSGDQAFLLIEGEVSVTRAKGAEPRIKEINRMAPKEMFGVISLIDSKERTATCQARGPVKVASLSRDKFNALREQSPAAAHHIQRIISRQISRDHKYFSLEVRDVIFSDHAVEALKSQDGLFITDSYKGPDRRVAPSPNYGGPERRRD